MKRPVSPPWVLAAPFGGADHLVRRVERECERTGQDVIRVFGFPFPLYCFRHPEHIRQIYSQNPDTRATKNPRLLPRVREVMGRGSFIHPGGEEWKRRRQLLYPLLSPEGAATLAERAAGIIENVVARWPAGTPLNLETLLGELVTDLAFQLFMSHPLGERCAEIYRATHRLVDQFADVLPLWIPLPRHRAFRRHQRQVQACVDAVINERLKAGFGDDLLGKLLVGLAADRSPGSLRDAREELLSVYFGASTMKIGMAWMLHAVSANPTAADCLRAELTTVCGDRTPAVRELEKLKWPMMIFNETTRLYPPVWGFPRFSFHETAVGPYRIPSGSLLFPLGYLAHRHREYWDTPESFRPERFAPECLGAIHPFAHYPFGYGPRMCPGSRLAPLLFQQVLLAICRRYRFRVTPEQPGMKFAFELTPRVPLMIQLEPV